MPRPKRATLKRSRPVIPIDWDQVDKLLIAGCLGTEIASAIGCCPATLYERTLLEKGMIFSQYSREKKEKGDTLLRQAQFAKAIKGDNTMLIWLGKLRLAQRDPDKGDTLILSNEAAAAALRQIENKTKDPINKKPLEAMYGNDWCPADENEKFRAEHGTVG